MGDCAALRYEGGGVMTQGEIAYREDVRRMGVYPDGSPRRSWDQLGADIRANWEKHPTPRVWGRNDAAVFDALMAVLELKGN